VNRILSDRARAWLAAGMVVLVAAAAGTWTYFVPPDTLARVGRTGSILGVAGLVFIAGVVVGGLVWARTERDQEGPGDGGVDDPPPCEPTPDAIDEELRRIIAEETSRWPAP